MRYPDGSKCAESNGALIDWFEDEDLMQSTNLKDKNGKEIYEGDVVRSDSGDTPAVWEVVYDAPSFRLSERLNRVNLVKVIASHQEIIGNIYENPELLA